MAPNNINATSDDVMNKIKYIPLRFGVISLITLIPKNLDNV